MMSIVIVIIQTEKKLKQFLFRLNSYMLRRIEMTGKNTTFEDLKTLVIRE